VLLCVSEMGAVASGAIGQGSPRDRRPVSLFASRRSSKAPGKRAVASFNRVASISLGSLLPHAGGTGPCGT